MGKRKTVRRELHRYSNSGGWWDVTVTSSRSKEAIKPGVSVRFRDGHLYELISGNPDNPDDVVAYHRAVDMSNPRDVEALRMKRVILEAKLKERLGGHPAFEALDAIDDLPTRDRMFDALLEAVAYGGLRCVEGGLNSGETRRAVEKKVNTKKAERNRRIVEAYNERVLRGETHTHATDEIGKDEEIIGKGKSLTGNQVRNIVNEAKRKTVNLNP